MLLGAAPDADPVDYAKALDAAAKAVGVNFIGGYGALVHKGFSAGDERLIESHPPRAGRDRPGLLQRQRRLHQVGHQHGRRGHDGPGRPRQAAERTKPTTMCMGDAKLVVFCNAPEDNPFMAGAFHGPGEPDCEVHVGVSGPGAVRAALAKLPKDAPHGRGGRAGQAHRLQDHPAGPAGGQPGRQELGVPFGIVDLSLAPTPAIGDSVANILEEMGLESCGCCGTTAALALLNDAVKKGGVMASNHVGGLSGAFIPVSEDDGMIKAAERGSLSWRSWKP